MDEKSIPGSGHGMYRPDEPPRGAAAAAAAAATAATAGSSYIGDGNSLRYLAAVEQVPEVENKKKLRGMRYDMTKSRGSMVFCSLWFLVRAHTPLSRRVAILFGVAPLL